MRCGRCCTSFGVCTTIFDIIRIVDASGGKLVPLDFVTITPEPPDRERTEPSILINGIPYLLILKWKPKKDQECVFYDKDRGCVIYESRPILCRTYPFKSEKNKLENMKSRACPCFWIPNDKTQYLSDLKTYEKELSKYKKIVDNWNKKEKTRETLKEFLDFAIQAANK